MAQAPAPSCLIIMMSLSQTWQQEHGSVFATQVWLLAPAWAGPWVPSMHMHTMIWTSGRPHWHHWHQPNGKCHGTLPAAWHGLTL